jgi:hypothetical protein
VIRSTLIGLLALAAALPPAGHAATADPALPEIWIKSGAYLAGRPPVDNMWDPRRALADGRRLDRCQLERARHAEPEAAVRGDARPGISFAVIYNADASTKTNENWEQNAELHIAEIETALAIRPDFAVFDSWTIHDESTPSCLEPFPLTVGLPAPGVL